MKYLSALLAASLLTIPSAVTPLDGKTTRYNTVPNALIIYNACKTHSRNRNPNHTHNGSHSSHHKWTIITTIKNNKHDIRTMC